MFACMVGVQLGHDLPRDIGHGTPAGDGARQIDLDGIDQRDVVHDLPHRATIGSRGRSSPLGVRKTLGKCRETTGSLLDASGQRLSATTHAVPPCCGWPSKVPFAMLPQDIVSHQRHSTPYSTIAPLVSPETIRRSNASTRATSGNVAIRMAAESCPQGIW